MFKKYIYFCMLVGISTLSIQAQTISRNNDVWFHLVNKNMLTKKLSFTFEGTMRFANGLSEKQQYFVRPSFDYKINKILTTSLGYTHYTTYVYGSPALNKMPIPENHVWIQTTFNHQFGDLKMTNRLRDEFRNVGVAMKGIDGNYHIDHYDYRNRLRYMLMFNYPITKSGKQTKLFALAGDEVFLNIGKNSGKTLLNQNRIIVGLGYNFDANNQVQLCYIEQRIWNFSNTIQEINPTVRISYLVNTSWVRKAKNN